MDAFGIFEGGGAKGLAYVGALKAAETRRVKFLGVAGTSVGAIVASLVAAGYKADELYVPTGKDSATGVFAENFLDKFLDKDKWLEFSGFNDSVQKTLSSATSPINAFWAICKFSWSQKTVLASLLKNRGFLDTKKISNWIDELLKVKVRNGDMSGSNVMFKEVPGLKIIATDLTNQRPYVYCALKTPNFSIAEAVSASLCIPLIFTPKIIDGLTLVDGGLSSNFPAWAFDVERKQEKPLTPTFGFRLVPMPTQAIPEVETSIGSSMFRYCSALFKTAVFGDYSLETREVESLHEIPLHVDVSTLEFSISPERCNNLYREGNFGANKFFDTYIGPDDTSVVIRQLRACHGFMLNTLAELNVPRNIHLRVNVSRPISDRRLKIVYNYGMDRTDTDDMLEFVLGTGTIGNCWENRDIVLCDLEDTEIGWGLDKYQLRLVRPTLKSIMSVPIFDIDTLLSDGHPNKKTIMLGVLSFDSDDRLVDKFAERHFQDQARECAKLIAKSLKR